MTREGFVLTKQRRIAEGMGKRSSKNQHELSRMFSARITATMHDIKSIIVFLNKNIREEEICYGEKIKDLIKKEDLILAVSKIEEVEKLLLDLKERIKKEEKH